MPAATYSDLAALMGRTVSPEQGNAVIQNITAMVKAYTRGEGFADGVPNDELRAVILSAACRMIANPRGIELARVLDRSRFRSVVRSPGGLSLRRSP